MINEIEETLNQIVNDSYDVYITFIYYSSTILFFYYTCNYMFY